MDAQRLEAAARRDCHELHGIAVTEDRRRERVAEVHIEPAEGAIAADVAEAGERVVDAYPQDAAAAHLVERASTAG